MKKRIVLIAITAVIVLTGVLVAVLVNQPKVLRALESFKPQSVSGNGGTAVAVDDYLYFVEGYVDYTTIGYRENDYYHNGKVQDGAIYRVKLVNGAPEYVYDNEIPEQDEGATPIQDEDGDGQYDVTDEEHYNKKIDYIKNVDVIVPKIAGHRATALWVYGNTLIYTSPNNMKNNVGVLQSGRLDFFKVNINRDSKTNVKLYTSTSTSLTANDFSVVCIDGQIYLLVNDGGKLIRTNINGKTDVIEKDVTSVAFPKVTAYMENSVNTSLKLDNAFKGVMQYVYFVKAREEDDTVKGNKMYRCLISDFSKDAEEIASQGNSQQGSTYTPLAVGDGRFLFNVAQTNAAAGTQPTVYMSSGIDDNYQDLTGLNSLYSLDMYPTETKFYLGTEITGMARLLILSGTNLRVGTPVADGTINIEDEPLATDASEVLLATANRIYYQDAGGYINIIELDNGEWNETGATISTAGKNANMPVSIVQTTGAFGRLVFVIADITDNTDTEEVESGTNLFLCDENGTKYTLYTKTHQEE